MTEMKVRVVPSGSKEEREKRFSKALDLATSFLIEKEDGESRRRNTESERGAS